MEEAQEEGIRKIQKENERVDIPELRIEVKTVEQERVSL